MIRRSDKGDAQTATSSPKTGFSIWGHRAPPQYLPASRAALAQVWEKFPPPDSNPDSSKHQS